jgi:hypothetical protein
MMLFTIDLRASDIFIRKYQMKVPLILLVLFGIFLSLPATFRTTRDLMGPWIADSAGDPTGPGFLFHALVLTILVLGLSKTISTFAGENNKAERNAKGAYTMNDYETGRQCASPSESTPPGSPPAPAYTGVIQSDLTTCI